MLANRSCCMHKQMKIEQQVERLYSMCSLLRKTKAGGKTQKPSGGVFIDQRMSAKYCIDLLMTETFVLLIIYH